MSQERDRKPAERALVRKELCALGSPRKGPNVRSAGIVEGQGQVKTEGLIHRLDSEQLDRRSSPCPSEGCVLTLPGGEQGPISIFPPVSRGVLPPPV